MSIAQWPGKQVEWRGCRLIETGWASIVFKRFNLSIIIMDWFRIGREAVMAWSRTGL